MINFYRLAENLHQVCIRDLSIYYSYKIPAAYRVGKDLRVSESMVKQHFDIITAGHKYLLTNKTKFNFDLKYLFKSTIYNLAEDFTLEKLKIKKVLKTQPIYIGELNVNKLSNIS